MYRPVASGSAAPPPPPPPPGAAPADDDATAAPAPTAASGAASGVAEAGGMSPLFLDIREAGLIPEALKAPEAPEIDVGGAVMSGLPCREAGRKNCKTRAETEAVAAVAAEVAALFQRSAPGRGGDAGGQSPVAVGVDSDGTGGDSGCDSGCDSGSGGGSGGGSGTDGGSYEGAIGGGEGAAATAISTATATWSARGTSRGRVFEAIAEIARDPPLNFSEDILEVMKGGDREAPPELAGSQEGGTDQEVGGYGPKMDRVIDSLMSLGR